MTSVIRAGRRKVPSGHTYAVAYRLQALRPNYLFFFGRDLRFDIHVAELTRFEDLAAFEALDIFRIFVSRDYLDSGMPTLVVHRVALGIVVGCICRLANVHKKVSLKLKK